MSLKLHTLAEGMHEFNINEYELDTRIPAKVGSTFHMGGDVVRVIKVVNRDEVNGTLQVEVKHWIDNDDTA